MLGKLKRILTFNGAYFVFLLPVFFIMHRYNENRGRIPLDEMFYLLIQYFLFVVVSVFLLQRIFASSRKAALFVFLLLAFHLTFGILHDSAKDAFPNHWVTRYSFILPAVILLFVTLLVFFKKSKAAFPSLARYLNVLMVVLVFMEFGQLAIQAFVKSNPATKSAAAATGLAPCDTCMTADIHLIVPDGYPGDGALQELFQYDNHAFSDSLRKRGFMIVDSTTSNYNHTTLSMASLFNMDYLADLDRSEGALYHYSTSLINENLFTGFMQKQGYEVANFSIFDFENIPAYAEGFFTKDIELITNNTFLYRLNKDVGYHLYLALGWTGQLEKVSKVTEYQAKRDLRKMDSVIRRVQQQHQKPVFYYTHLMMPHPPYSFDENGKFVQMEFHPQPGIMKNEKEHFLGYLKYTNRKLLLFIDQILAYTAKPPIILLLSDHGYRSTTINAKHHFSNYCAVLLPQGQKNLWYRGMSHVNAMRLFLNGAFHQQLPLLKDSTYFMPLD